MEKQIYCLLHSDCELEIHASRIFVRLFL